MISRLPDPVGRACIIPETGERMITAVDCTILRFDRLTVLPEFFVYFAQSRDYLSEIAALSTGTTRLRISRANLGNVTVPLPPLDEQKRIVAVLDEAFDGLSRARANANLADARELFETKTTLALTNKHGWQEASLADLCDIITDGTHQTPRYFDNGFVFLSAKNIVRERIDWQDIKYIDPVQHGEMQRRVSPRRGDILLRKNGAGYGKAGLVDRDEIFDIYVSLALLRPKSKVTPDFLLRCINSPNCMKQFNARIKGQGVPNLHLQEIRQVRVFYPASTEEQEKVANELLALTNEFDSASAKIKEKIHLLDSLRRSLLQKAFSGELTCPNLFP